MSRLLSLLGGWKGYAAVALVSALLATSGTYHVTALGYRLAIADMRRDQADAAARTSQGALVQFQSDAVRVHQAADRFSAVQGTLDQKFSALSKDFHDAAKVHPLPADCVPDAGRLRRLRAAVAAANAAAGGEPGGAMPPAR